MSGTIMKNQFDVVIVGGGPGGSLLSLILAQQGLQVALVEKQKQLERSFRGETVAASSVRILDQLGLLNRIADKGYLTVEGMAMMDKGQTIFTLDYDAFPGTFKRAIDLPQPHLLSVLLEEASKFQNFTYLNGCAFESLIRDDAQRVIGVEVSAEAGQLRQLYAKQVVASDGRYSKVRKAAGIQAQLKPVERDIIWFKLPRPKDWNDRGKLLLKGSSHVFIIPTWPDFLRVGLNIPKGGFQQLRKRGIEAFVEDVVSIAPEIAPLVREHVRSWKDVTLLDVFVASVDQWAIDGLLLIGDASHTVSPILGQGVNLAIQDAFVLGPLLTQLLRSKSTISAHDFAAYVAERKKHKTIVTNYQLKQEQNLAAHGWAATIRHYKMRLFDRLPIKYKALDRVLNYPATDAIARLAVSG
ncbi:MAG TPA: FAD-dependent monooxygenase [Oligoflexus sp.]|uniref:FAD-dependent monooxygenase n=1 Tax=Oligoflexus sp. TaxID=1971216 RepID=UPI002D7F2C3B|nr:FAD-dependent monooxygenase [Oligoflexus sp.]HET9238182.1 FAD-dependent monooxygenase [Oligoflexus sp.]